MAGKPKYDAELLLYAVVKYASECRGKIKTTELAEWAQKNIKGLEHVTYYDFTRKIVTVDKKGKKIETKRPCTKKIEEINAVREQVKWNDARVLLGYSCIDVPNRFFALNRMQQETEIWAARSYVYDLKSERTKTKNKYNKLQGEVLEQYMVLKAELKEETPSLEKISKYVANLGEILSKHELMGTTVK